MSGRAILSVQDDRDGAFDLEVVWEKDYDVDAVATIPGRVEPVWRLAQEILEQEHDGARSKVYPYPTLPIFVQIDAIGRTATGIYAIARAAWGRGVSWKLSPPYPSFNLPKGAIS